MAVDQRRSTMLAQRISLAASITGVVTVFALVLERKALATAGLAATGILLGITTVAGRKAWGRDMRLGWIGVFAIAILLAVILVMNAIGKGLEDMRF